jgi:hypothetical protein
MRRIGAAALGIGDAPSKFRNRPVSTVRRTVTKFRRVKGFKFMSALVAALRPTTTSLESESKVA